MRLQHLPRNRYYMGVHASLAPIILPEEERVSTGNTFNVDTHKFQDYCADMGNREFGLLLRLVFEFAENGPIPPRPGYVAALCRCEHHEESIDMVLRVRNNHFVQTDEGTFVPNKRLSACLTH